MQFHQLKRRKFITLLGGAAVWPLAARSQQPAMPVVGYLSVGAPLAHLLALFKQSLAEAGQAALHAIGGASLRLN